MFSVFPAGYRGCWDMHSRHSPKYENAANRDIMNVKVKTIFHISAMNKARWMMTRTIRDSGSLYSRRSQRNEETQ